MHLHGCLQEGCSSSSSSCVVVALRQHSKSGRQACRNGAAQHAWLAQGCSAQQRCFDATRQASFMPVK
jgi:hypothetical protein